MSKLFTFFKHHKPAAKKHEDDNSLDNAKNYIKEKTQQLINEHFDSFSDADKIKYISSVKADMLKADKLAEFATIPNEEEKEILLRTALLQTINNDLQLNGERWNYSLENHPTTLTPNQQCLYNFDADTVWLKTNMNVKKTEQALAKLTLRK